MTVFLAAVPVAAQEVRLIRVGPMLLELTGGTGASAWRLRYGTVYDANRERSWTSKAAVVTVSPDRAYFSHGQWLRLIDAQQGVVLGRWRFPCPVASVVPTGNRATVRLQCERDAWIGVPGKRDRVASALPPLIFTFDPESPVVPYWPPGPPVANRVPFAEATVYASVPSPLAYVNAGLNRLCTQPATPAARQFQASVETPEVLAEAETMVRRDPFSPWLRVVVGKLMRHASDARASAVLDAAVDTPSADFTELFDLSAYLERCGEPLPAARAFDRASERFWAHGNDPRMLSVLIARLLMYAPFQRNQATPTAQRDEIFERVYRLAPRAEGAELAWAMRAEELEQHGRPQDAQLWRRRAEDADGQSLYLTNTQTLIVVDRVLRVVMASIAAAILLVLMLFVKYRPQRRLTLAARGRRGGLARGFSLFNLEYWSGRERVALMCVTLAGWLATGLLGAPARLVSRMASIPLGQGSGSYAGPDSIRFFERDLPASPERDLLLAVAYQQAGDTDKAERLYRSLPSFAESWNNLGVLLANAGRSAEARDAFERALRLDPSLAEASLNLGRGANDPWTELHVKYVPGQPMTAPPRRPHALRAFLGESTGGLARLALGGPFTMRGRVDEVLSVFGMDPLTGTGAFLRATMVLGPLVCAALVIVAFAIPTRDVTQPPGRAHWLWEIALPGASPSWAWLGSPALMLWMYLFLEMFLRLGWGTENIVTDIAMTGLPAAYGAPNGFVPYHFISSGAVWVYGPLALLFGVNLWVVLRARRAQQSS